MSYGDLNSPDPHVHYATQENETIERLIER